MTIRQFSKKITRDLLISFLITYFLILIPEIVLPGIISSHFNLKYFLVAILGLGLLYILQNGESHPAESSKFRAVSRNILNIILFTITIMLFLSLYKMKLWQIFVVAVFSVFLVSVAGKMLGKEPEN